jgi:uncharacterized membrane protein HdeD (DUF308 family)
MDMSIAVMDVESLARNWWAVVLRGIAGILFGLMTFFAPGISLAALVLLFGAYAFTDGIFSLVAAARHRGGEPWWMLLLHGLAGVGAGVVTLIWPAITALALLYVIAFWALITGGFEIAAAIRLRQVLTGEWLLILSGIASVGLGILLVLFPGPGALALILWIGAYAFVSGAFLMALGFKLKSWSKDNVVQPQMAHGAT